MTLSLEQTLIADLMGYPVMTEEEGSDYPEMSLCSKPQRINADGWPEIRWCSDWYPVPSMAELEEWTFDSVCENPRGDCVEPDHPDSWLAIFGLI
ncbi:MAG: hypothetical protein ACO236_00420 [Candidatus Nanopelagicaceae bacterium]